MCSPREPPKFFRSGRNPGIHHEFERVGVPSRPDVSHASYGGIDGLGLVHGDFLRAYV